MGETGCDIWEKMGSLELHEKNKNSFLTYGGNGVRHMGEKGSLKLHVKRKNSFLTYGGNGVRDMGKRVLSSCTKKKEFISDIWGKRGATYGENGSFKLHEKRKN